MLRAASAGHGGGAEVTDSAPRAPAPPPRPAAARRGVTDLLVAAALAAIAAAVSVPLMRLAPPGPDEGAMLTGAAKLLRGGIFYRDVAAFPMPGAWYLLAAAMRLGGETVAAARVLVTISFSATVGLFYLIASRVLRRPLALGLGLALLAVKFWAWPAWSAYLYCDPAFAFASGGVLAFLAGWQRRRAAYLLGSGLLLAASGLCKQTVGFGAGAAALALLALGWTVERFFPGRLRLRDLLGLGGGNWMARGARAFVAGGALMLAVPCIYFGSHGLLDDLLVGGLVRPISGYLPLSKVSYTEMLNWAHFGRLTAGGMLPYKPTVVALAVSGRDLILSSRAWEPLAEGYVRLVYLLIPLLFAAAAIGVLRRTDAVEPDGERLPRVDAAALALLVALFASAFPRADYYHVMDVAPAWLLAGFMGASGWVERAKGRLQRRIVTAGVIGVAAAWLAAGSIAMAAAWGRCDAILDLPRCGRIRALSLSREIESTVAYISAHTRAGTPLFVLGHEAYYYFLADRYSPWPFAQMYPGQVGRGEGEEVARMIERHRIPYIIQGPPTRGGLPPLRWYAPKLVRYVERNYEMVGARRTAGVTYAGSKVLRRRDLGRNGGGDEAG